MERGTSLYAADRPVAPQLVRIQTDRRIDRQRLWLGVLIVAVVVVDQTTKWWAWRHSGTVTINSGGDEFVGDVVGSWFGSSVGGAILDILDAVVLASALAWIVRRRRPTPVLLSSALASGGWVSNLSDRLGLHYWTAPDSVRGAVDFLRVGRGAVFNGADITIVVGTIGLGVSLYYYRRDQRERSALEAALPAVRRQRNPVRSAWPVIGLLLVAVLAVHGVTHPGWVYVPPRLWPSG
jgi:lipoprotein signal peptidase